MKWLSRIALGALVLLQLFISTVHSAVDYQDLQYRDYVDQLMGRHDADGDPAGFELTSRGGLEAERAALLEARDVIQNEIKDLVARMVAARRDGSPPDDQQNLQYRGHIDELMGRSATDDLPDSTNGAPTSTGLRARFLKQFPTDSFEPWIQGEFPKPLTSHAAKLGCIKHLQDQFKDSHPTIKELTESHVTLKYQRGADREWVAWEPPLVLQDVSERGTTRLDILVYVDVPKQS